MRQSVTRLTARAKYLGRHLVNTIPEVSNRDPGRQPTHADSLDNSQVAGEGLDKVRAVGACVSALQDHL